MAADLTYLLFFALAVASRTCSELMNAGARQRGVDPRSRSAPSAEPPGSLMQHGAGWPASDSAGQANTTHPGPDVLRAGGLDADGYKWKRKRPGCDSNARPAI